MSDRLSVHLSFSELAWLLVMVAVMAFSVYYRQTKEDLEKQEQEIANLEKKLDQKEEIIKQLKQELDNLKKYNNLPDADIVNKIISDYDRMQEKARQEGFTNVVELIESLEKQLSEKSKRIKILEEELSELQEQIENEVGLQKEFSIVSKDLIGIKGNLNKVACVVDCSSSMASRDKWRKTKSIISTWVSNLDIEHLMLIIDSYDPKKIRNVNYVPEVFSNKFFYVKKSQHGGSNDNLKIVIDRLDSILPGGSSDTYKALEKAYSFKPETVILFTDGSPTRTGDIAFDKNEMEKIRGLVGRNRKIPVNVIGIGDYFHQEVGSHIREITRTSGGTFIGR